MALITRGASRCTICGKLLEQDDDVVSFSAFIANELDPLFFFNDAAFHRRCVDCHPRGNEVQVRYAEARKRLQPGNRRCGVCGAEILDPDDYVAFGYVAADSDHAISEFNYLQLHRSHVPAWPERRRAIAALEDLQASGKWAGPALTTLITALSV